MLPVLVLAAICGVLAQNVHGNSYPLISVNLSPERLQQVFSAQVDTQAWKGKLQNLPLEESLRSGMGQGGGAKGLLGVGNIFGGLVTNIASGILGLHIKKVEVLALDLRLNEIEKSFMLTFPFILEVQLNIPLTKSNLIDLKLSLDIQIGVRLQKNPSTGYTRLVLGGCQNNPGHVRVTLLDNKQPLFKAINDLLRSVTNILEKTIPFILQQQICPLANGALQLVLDLLINPNSKGAHGQTMQLSANSFDISSGGMKIDYETSLKAAGGGSYVLPPNPKPLPSVPLGDSSMNIILSGQLVSGVIASALPAKTINIDNKEQVAEFGGYLEATRGFSMPPGANIQALQISYGVPTARLAYGTIEVLQDFEIKVFGKGPHGGAHQLFASIKGRTDSIATANVNRGNLIFSLTLKRLINLSLEESSVGNIDGRYLYNTVFKMLSSLLVPHENSLLSSGYTLPMADGSFETDEYQVTMSEDSLVLYSGEQQVQTMETTMEWVTWQEI